MRENEIRLMHQADAKRMILLFKQFTFLNTRMQAYETILTNRKAMLRAIWNPRWLKTAVDTIQAELLKQSDEHVREAAQKPKIEIVGANGVTHG